MSKDSESPYALGPLTFSTYEIWEGKNVECHLCGWRGQLSNERKHLENDWVEILCGNCSEAVAFITFPSKAEAKAAQDQQTVTMFEVMEANTSAFERERLSSADQLPDIDSDEIFISWDTVESGKDNPRSYTCFKHEEVILFKEPPIYESGWRYREVATIFREKYGDRLKDIIPTWGGWLYLAGDSFRSRGEAESAREEFFGRPSERANA
jgi:hypothetical protein